MYASAKPIVLSKKIAIITKTHCLFVSFFSFIIIISYLKIRIIKHIRYYLISHIIYISYSPIINNNIFYYQYQFTKLQTILYLYVV